MELSADRRYIRKNIVANIAAGKYRFLPISYKNVLTSNG